VRNFGVSSCGGVLPNPDWREPVIRQFRSDLTLVLRDGQTVDSTFATDPLSGKVFKGEVALSLVK